MRKTTKLFPVLIFFFILSLSGCYVEPSFVPEFPVGIVEGYQPLYLAEDQVSIEYLSARSLQHPGKIYLIGDYLLVNEKYEGIHVFNNADPSAPVALGFLRIPGSTEMAIRGDVLYANHLTDLVALNIADWNDIRELSRLKQEYWSQEVPPQGGRYFACVDKSKGVVVGWELATLKDPKCFR
jgi:hypothetical protein